MITCSACHQTNRLHRGFCGQCGVTLQPVCRGCRFVNEGHDKFCGGCGSSLDDRLQASAPPPAIVQPPRPARPLSIVFAAPPSAIAPASVPSAGSASTSVSESDELFAPVAVTPDDGLPSAGITQADLDRLFGAGS